jgi:hypothetical protein
MFNRKNMLGGVLLLLLLTSCFETQKIQRENINQFEVVLDVSQIESVTSFLGNPDDSLELLNCGTNVAYSRITKFYKNRGLAILTDANNPELDHHKNNLVRIIQIFDSTDLVMINGKQRFKHFYDNHTTVSDSTLIKMYGNPDSIKIYKKNYSLFYGKKHMVFMFEKKSRKFIRLYIDK